MSGTRMVFELILFLQSIKSGDSPPRMMMVIQILGVGVLIALVFECNHETQTQESLGKKAIVSQPPQSVGMAMG
jgi:hypothetical protein